MNKGEIMTNLNCMKNFKKVLPLLMLPLAYGVNATDVTASLTFDTLPIITIDEETPMDFGPVLTLAQADTCTLSATVGAIIVEADDGDASTTPAGGNLSGTCGTSTGQPGVYTINSVASADIQVSVVAGAATELLFTPVGVVISPLAGTRVTLDGATPAVVVASAALNAYTAAGTNRVIMGGTVVNQSSLVSGDTYSTTFDLNVIYQ
jgi:hypothetical protein